MERRTSKLPWILAALRSVRQRQFTGHATSMVVIFVAGCSGAVEPSTSRPSPSSFERVTPANVSGVVGTEISPAPTVRVRDRDGHPLAGIAVVFSAEANSGSLLHQSVETDVDGLAAPGRWVLGLRAGNQTIAAHSRSLESLSFTATARAGPVAAITRVDGNNQSGLSGAALAKPLLVRVVDSFSNAIAGAPVIFTVIGGAGNIAGDTARTNEAGIATSPAWTLGQTGSQQVKAQSESADVVFDAVACKGVVWGCGEFDESDTTLVFVRQDKLYRVAIDGTSLTRMTDVGVHYAPAWSPDGSRLAFVRYDGSPATGNFISGIYIMNAAGDLNRRMTIEGYSALAWSPDGQKLAVSVYESFGESIYVISANADGTKPVRVTQGSSPTWSPDGLSIAFMRFGDIYSTGADGVGLTKLISSSGSRWFADPAWSPDSRGVAVTVFTNCDWDDDCDTAIGVLDRGASDVRVLSRGARSASYVSRPAWSSNGRMLAFQKYACIANDCGSFVSAISADGSGERVIVLNGRSPSWRP